MMDHTILFQFSISFQLYMIPEIRSGVLSADVGFNEDDDDVEEKGMREQVSVKAV